MSTMHILDRRPILIHEKLMYWASHTPTAVAVRWADENLSYAQLDEDSSALAVYLQEQGIGRGDLVAIYFSPCASTLIAIMAVLKNGAAYVPLDTTNPPFRLALMIEQLPSLRLIFVSTSTQGALAHSSTKIVEIESLRRQLSATSCSGKQFKPPTHPDDFCYVVFTSGTTGVPKAVAISHRCWANLIDWHVETFQQNYQSHGILASTFGFDISQRSLVTPLYAGAAISIASSTVFDSYEIVQLIEQHRVASIHLAPSSLYLILQAGKNSGQLSGLRHLFIGGEALSPAKVMAWAATEGRNCRLIHQYGVAECTDVATSHCMSNYEQYLANGIPMGDPVGNCYVDILDEHGRPVEPGDVGQIVISGAGVGKGYLNNQDLQAERFKVMDIKGTRRLVYLTGDYARRLPNGQSICLGRKDNQIKVRGMLVNLSEIEISVCNALAMVEDVIVIDNSETADHSAKLTAFVTTTSELPELKEITARLDRILPRHMHPYRYIICDTFPLTQNGKIDRQALLNTSLNTH